MKIAVASDIHGKYRDIEYPSADLLIFAGDLLPDYAWGRKGVYFQLNSLQDFNEHIKDLKLNGIYKEIIVIAGNHDWCFEYENSQSRSILKDAIYIQDESCEIEGIKIYGSPWTPWFYDWAFNFPDHNASFFKAKHRAELCWSNIPNDTQILITHGPPYGILDKTKPRKIRDRIYPSKKVGCPFLEQRLRQLAQLKLHIFGHIHPSRGQKKIGRTLYVNASICGDKHEPINSIQTIDWSSL